LANHSFVVQITNGKKWQKIFTIKHITNNGNLRLSRRSSKMALVSSRIKINDIMIAFELIGRPFEK
jgi:hypothetical protein